MTKVGYIECPVFECYQSVRVNQDDSDEELIAALHNHIMRKEFPKHTPEAIAFAAAEMTIK
tara:strand:- start:778 stop:960 length:183 start_codon:yes stop_codon:yes gene_type:complete